MANSWSALAPVNFMPKVQRYINKKLVAKALARTEFREQLRSGQTIDWPYTTDMRTQSYTEGTDLTIDSNTATSDTMSINVSRAVTWTLGPNQQAQAEDKTMNDKMAFQAAHQIASDMDQRVFDTAIDGANNTQAGGTLSVSNIYSTLTTAMSTLQRNNIDMVPYAVLDPERVALLAQFEVGNGFNKADAAMSNGFVGTSAAGFELYRSNNLPTSVTLTVDTQPINGDTFTIFGQTLTCVTDGSTADEGEINIGANLADFKLILVDALNGGSSYTSDWTISANGTIRRAFQNAGLSAATFDGDDCVLTAYGKIGGTETFDEATNVFGTETGNILIGGKGAVSLGMQIEPTMASAPVAARPMETNYAIHTLYGHKVFQRDADLLVNLTLNI